ncbi:MAG: N-acetyl sugar amidotransferase [Bacteroidales bacterium]|nr:N-acetyl sugar amidotransferase [Bacteroidales bacterium]MBN2757789.1 N-acetyl sugar amidotransferase [Bacteroidales bacterium]
MKHIVNPKYIPKNYQQCTKTVMDNIADPNITFDENGVCNYYHEYFIEEAKHVYKGKRGIQKFKESIQKIKNEGKGKKYDCILGVSGGVDSSYLAYIAKAEGLRVLCVHFDNGWNSELAVKNIENIVTKLNFDLETYVINWNEFRDIQLAFFKANVIDIEMITDHAIFGTIYKIANKNNIKYILSGNNVVTESLLPKHWIFNKADYVNIKDIHKHYGTLPLKTFPFFGFKEKHFYQQVKGISTIDLLNFIPYIKTEVKQLIKKELNWEDYGGKHFESIFTRFYQGYILPQKFGIDKRKAHLSNLICSGQITKEEALKELENPNYDKAQCQEDKEFVLKKLGFYVQEFESYLSQERREHSEFKTEQAIYLNHPVLKPLKPIGDWIKRILK